MIRPKRLHGQEAAFLDHLEEIRRRVLVSVGLVLLTAAAALFFAEKLIEILRVPIGGLDVSLIYIKPQEKFVTYLRVSLFAGILLGIPFLVVEASLFVLPGLTRGEKRWFIPTVAAVLLLFTAGIAFGFLLLTPFALRFLAGFASEGDLLPFWSIGGYVQFVVSVTLICGLLFLLPVLLFFLFAAGILQVETAARARKFVILGIFLAAALLTPPDIFTQVSVGVLLYLLFELSLAAGRLVARKKRDSEGGSDE